MQLKPDFWVNTQQRLLPHTPAYDCPQGGAKFLAYEAIHSEISIKKKHYSLCKLKELTQLCKILYRNQHFQNYVCPERSHL